jgi:tetratricopeptide (TPR) repeat protein
MPRPRNPSPFDKAFKVLMDRAQDKAAPAPARVEAAMKAGALAAPSDSAKAVAAFRLAASLDPLDGRAAIAAGAHLARLGAYAEARDLAGHAFQQALDEGIRAEAAFLLGEIALGGEAIDEALDAFQAAEQLFDALHRRDRTDPECLLAIARLNLRLTDVALLQGDQRAAGVCLPRAAAIIDALQRQNPDDAELAAEARACIDRQIDLALAVEDVAVAQGWISRLLPMAERAAADRKPATLRNLALLRLKESAVAERLGDHSGATSAADQALAKIALALNGRPQDSALLRDYARALKRRADLDLRRGEGAFAATLAAKAIAILDSLLADDSAHKGLAHEHAGLCILAGDAALRQNQLEQAQTFFSAAMVRCKAFASTKGPWTLALAVAHDRLGDVALQLGHPARARGSYAEALSLRRAAAAQTAAQTTAADVGALAVSASKLGEAALAQGDAQGARAAFRECLSIRLKLHEADDHNPALRRQVALALERVGLAAQACGQRLEARAAFEDELTLAQEDLQIMPDEPSVKRFAAIVHAHLASLKEADSGHHRAEALRLLESMMTKGQATAKDLALQRQLAGI